MISTAKALINSNNPNILIQLYTSENDLTTNGHVRCYTINSKFTNRFGFKNRPCNINLISIYRPFSKKVGGVAPPTHTPPPRPARYAPDYLILNITSFGTSCYTQAWMIHSIEIIQKYSVYYFYV